MKAFSSSGVTSEERGWTDMSRGPWGVKWQTKTYSVSPKRFRVWSSGPGQSRARTERFFDVVEVGV